MSIFQEPRGPAPKYELIPLRFINSYFAAIRCSPLLQTNIYTTCKARLQSSQSVKSMPPTGLTPLAPPTNQRWNRVRTPVIYSPPWCKQRAAVDAAGHGQDGHRHAFAGRAPDWQVERHIEEYVGAPRGPLHRGIAVIFLC